jgi:hypothetical protein
MYKGLPETSINESTDRIIPRNSPKYRMPLKSKPENILENLSVTPALFNTYLHENYLDFYESVDDIASASLYLSDSDLLDSSFSYLQKVVILHLPAHHHHHHYHHYPYRHHHHPDTQKPFIIN